MKKSKLTLRKKIFLSHISVVAVSLILTFLAFNLCLNFYIKKSTKKQLLETAKSIEKSMSDSANELNIKPKLENSSDISKYLMKINKSLKENKSFFHLDYEIVSPNKKLIYPQKNTLEDYEFVRDNLISEINEKKLMNYKKTDFYFDALGKRYGAIIYPLNISNASNDGYLIVYSDLIKISGFIKIVNVILLTMLPITTVFLVLISKNLSKKIAKPISKLSEYAKKIGERQYDNEFIEYNEDDEIGQLALTMEDMSKKLFNYDNAMKTFIQNASHEMRTPLMSIQGYAEGIKYGVVDDNEKAVNIIIEESKRLSLLVDDLLYLSKIEATKENFNFEEINLEYIIRSSLEKVSGIAIKNGKNIRFSCTDHSITFIGDQEKLIRAIINILGNSLRYCKNNIDIVLKKEDKKINIIIEDDGPGFDETHIKDIFNRFFKGKGGNYGLGLTITKSIIEQHGGTITCENSVNGGARFKITLSKA